MNSRLESKCRAKGMMVMVPAEPVAVTMMESMVKMMTVTVVASKVGPVVVVMVMVGICQ
jgi:hypothetical protein